MAIYPKSKMSTLHTHLARRGVTFDEYKGHSNITLPHVDDFSLSVPFDYPIDVTSIGRIAVVCHLYYPEMAAEFSQYFENIPCPFDLYISTDSIPKRDAILAVFSSWKIGRVEVVVVPNRGRDIAPKLALLSAINSKYDFVVCIHSKASTHHEDLKKWRGFLLHHLLGSPEIVKSILELFAVAPEIGMIGPQHHEPIRKWLGWSGNYEITRDVARCLGIELMTNHVLDFPSGSMFWARTSALKPLIDLNLAAEDFAPEEGQKDETIAHAIERLFYFSVECAGYKWVKIADSKYFNEMPGAVQVGSRDILKMVVSEKTSTLTKQLAGNGAGKDNDGRP